MDTSEIVQSHADIATMQQEIDEMNAEIARLKAENSEQKSALQKRKGSVLENDDTARFRDEVIEVIKVSLGESKQVSQQVADTMAKFITIGKEQMENQKKAIDNMEKMASSLNKWMTDFKNPGPTETTQATDWEVNQSENVTMENKRKAATSKMTYAQALSKSKIPYTAIRNIDILGETDDEKKQ